MLKNLIHHSGLGPLSMIAAGLCFSLMAVFVKALGRELSIFQISFFRSLVAIILIGLVLHLRKASLKGKQHKLLILRGMLGFLAIIFSFYALTQIPLADAATLHQTTPLLVILFSWIFLREVFPLYLVGLALLGFVGIALIFRPQGGVFNLGGLAALGCAILAALASILIRHLHQKDSFWTMVLYFMVVTNLGSLPLMILNWKTPSLNQSLMLAGTGLFGTLGQLFMTYAYKHDLASWVAPFAYAGVVFSFVWGILFFNEVPPLLTFLGAGLIVLSGILILSLKKKSQNPAL